MFDPKNVFDKTPEQVLAENGKSFYFASLVFNRRQRHDVARLYRVCRYIDDCADELPTLQLRGQALEQILSSLKKGEASEWAPELLLSEVSDLDSMGVSRQYFYHLLQGTQFDLEGGNVQTYEQLLVYCYQVAGVVGLLMCPLLGVRSSEALPYAVDLGIAMQLTNICRDIKEDGLNGRNYLPSNELALSDLNLQKLAPSPETPEALKTLVLKYLELADRFYESGYLGLAYIPFRPRVCILVAGEVYRAIGRKLRVSGLETLKGRTYLAGYEKVFVALMAFRKIFTSAFWFKQPLKLHDGQLHQPLTALPGTHAEGRVTPCLT